MKLALQQVGYSHRAATVPVLQNFNLMVSPGEIVGLHAASGSGKSTALQIAALLLPPTTGRVLLDAQEPTLRGAAARALRQKVGFIPQTPRAHADPLLSLGAIISAPAAFRDGRWWPRASRYRHELQRVCQAVRLPLDVLERRPGQVSDGQLQRALLARALILDPRLIICDEPTAHLDAQNTQHVLGVLRDRADAGAAVLIASHDHAALAPVADRLYELHQLQL